MAVLTRRANRSYAFTGFDPRTIGGLEFWIDPSDPSSVTYNGSAISAIADKSGRGRAFANAFAANQPLASTLAGRTAINIDTASKWLQSDFSLLYTAQTVICVCRPDAAVPVFARAHSQADGSSETPTGGYIPLIRNGSASPAQMTSFTNANFGPANFSTGVTTVFTARHSGSSFSVRANGVEGVTTSHTLNITFTRQRIGNGFSGADGFRGLFGDCLMFSRRLPDWQVAFLERWVALKWGTAL